ncbi:MAG: hypothetical protein ACKVHP_15375 [Verrucomicrobiales bacterium]
MQTILKYQNSSSNDGAMAAQINAVYALTQDELADLLSGLSVGDVSHYQKLLAEAACERWGTLTSVDVSREALEQLPDDLRAAVTGLVDIDATDTEIRALLEGAADDRDPQLTGYFKALARTNPDRALILLMSAKSPENQSSSYIEDVFQGFAAKDPAQAFAKAMTIHDWKRSIALGSVAEAWSEQDPEAALAGIESMEEDSDDWASAMGTAIAQWARKDLKGALHYLVEERPDLVTNGSCLSAASDSSAVHEADVLMEASAILPDPARAQWLAMSIESDRMPIDTALKLLEAIPPGKDHANASEAIAKRWAVDDWEGAVAWIGTLTQTESHDEALMHLAGQYYHDWDTKITLLQQMHQSNLAQENIRHRYQQWKRTVPQLPKRGCKKLRCCHLRSAKH